MDNNSAEIKEANLLRKLNTIFSHCPEGLIFTKLYCDYCHGIDDVIDNENDAREPENLLRLFILANKIFSSNYYSSRRHILAPVVELITSNYADSIKWENSPIEWQKIHADVLRHCGYDMLFIVISLECGYDVLREVSSDFREYSHNKHLCDLLNYECTSKAT